MEIHKILIGKHTHITITRTINNTKHSIKTKRPAPKSTKAFPVTLCNTSKSRRTSIKFVENSPAPYQVMAAQTADCWSALNQNPLLWTTPIILHQNSQKNRRFCLFVFCVVCVFWCFVFCVFLCVWFLFQMCVYVCLFSD